MIVRTIVGSIPRRALASSLPTAFTNCSDGFDSSLYTSRLIRKTRINRELSDNAQEKLDNAQVGNVYGLRLALSIAALNSAMILMLQLVIWKKDREEAC